MFSLFVFNIILGVRAFTPFAVKYINIKKNLKFKRQKSLLQS